MRVSSLFAALIFASSPLVSGVALRKEARASTSLRTGRMREAEIEVHNMNAVASEVMTAVRKAGHELEEAFEDKPAAKAEHVSATLHAEAKATSKKSSPPEVPKTAVPSSAVSKPEAKATSKKTSEAEVAKLAVPAPKSSHSPAAERKAALKEQQDVLTKLFAKLKTNIGDVNKGEKENKATNEQYLKADEAKLKHDQEQLKNPKLTAHQREILVNRTRGDEETVKYWKKGRELQHSMFHANLKIAHGLMSRVKSVLDAYGSAFTKGKLDHEAKDKLEKALGGMPHALIETRSELQRHRREYRSHRRSGHRLFGGIRLRL